MEQKEYQFMDKTSWGDGPWHEEPDKIQFEDPETGLPCLIVRNHSGSLCGYVGVTKGHPWFELQYDACDADVHGGLTYAAKCVERDTEHSICHVPGEGEDDDVWWLGFDCAHAGDLQPSYDLKYATAYGNVYRTFSYVRDQIALLARQARDVAQARAKETA